MGKFKFSTEWFVKTNILESKGVFQKNSVVLMGMSLPFKKEQIKKEWHKIKNLDKAGAYIYDY